MSTSTLTIDSEQSIVHGLNIGRPRPAMKWVWILGLGGVFFEAYAGAALASGLDPLTQELGLGPVEVSLVTSTYMFVAIFVCPFAGGLSDKFGRLNVLLAAKVLALLAMVIGMTAGSFEMLIVSRVLAGVAWAMDFGALLTYISEFLSDRHQSKLNRWQGMWYVATTSNLLITYVIYQFQVGTSIWRWLLASCAVVAVVLLVSQRAVLVESPRWLASKGRYAEATVALQRMYDFSGEAQVTAADDTLATAGEAREGGQIGVLFRAPYRRRTILANVAWVAEACQYYAIGWYLPIIALTLFGESFAAATLGAAVFNVLGIVGGFAAAGLAARLRIRGAVQLGFAACAVILVVFGLTLETAPLAMSILLPSLFILFHSALAAPGGAALSALAYPSHLRGLGMGVSTTFCNIGAAGGLFLFPLLQASLGTSGAIVAMAAVPFIGFLTATVIRWDPDRSTDSRGDALPEAATTPGSTEVAEVLGR
ncbi:MFS transporter [Micrococcus terreus]|uniref:Predicted arabinose efflux permease, MFS family n=1 Tax=Micrococcus terreus TaxID=574650 RepID=A0A1I7MST9_9MICC|nr:MFS transporter [Micrococcus terreus]SFV24919.1 Predicted arabinose efflux permease, MFS family [Micrococcus terreus]